MTWSFLHRESYIRCREAEGFRDWISKWGGGWIVDGWRGWGEDSFDVTQGYNKAGKECQEDF